MLANRVPRAAGIKAQARPDWNSPSGPREIDAGWMGAHAPITTCEKQLRDAVEFRCCLVSLSGRATGAAHSLVAACAWEVQKISPGSAEIIQVIVG